MINNLRYVAHIDILGFRSIVEKSDDDAWNLLAIFCNDTILALDNLYKNATLRDSDKPINERYKCVLFSDTLLIFTLSDEWEDLLIIVFLVGQLFAVSVEKCIPVRGAISYGKFSINEEKSLYVGKALIDAYDISESSQWQGIVVSDQVAEKLLTKNNAYASELIRKWNLEFKENDEIKSKDCYVINWVKAFKGRFNIPAPISVENWYKAFEKWFGPFENLHPSIQKKYINTVNFINDCLSVK